MKKIFVALMCLPFITHAIAEDDSGAVTKIISEAKGGGYNFFFHNDELSQALTILAKTNGLQIEFAADIPHKKIIQIVSGKYVAPDLSGVLNIIAKQYGVTWFISSGVLNIGNNNQVTSSVEVAADSMPGIKNNLLQLSMLDDKYGYTELPNENRILVTGPADYVQQLIKQIKSLNLAPSEQQFAVYHLNYASATDIQLTFNNQQITIPGVATILQTLLQSKNANANATVPLKSQISETTMNQLKQDVGTVNNNEQQSNSSPSSRGAVSTPLIQADNRLNTIIIRDKSVNLKVYKNLISLLDVPAPLIQVEVLVIHLKQDLLQSSGIDWWASGSNFSGGYGSANLSSAGKSNNIGFNYGQVNPGQMVVSNMTSFTSSLHSLETDGIAQAVGKPSVATIDNLPAMVNVTENLYVSGGVQGGAGGNPSSSSNYNGVQIMQSLQITPHVVHNNNEEQISLSIALEDGTINPMNNNAMPSTIQTALNSQAVIKDGQSLLLAGYTRDVSEKVEKKVPFLGDIPLLGWFFKSREEETHKVTTLYLVTPKIIMRDDIQKLSGSLTINQQKISIADDIQLYPKESSSVETKSKALSVESQIPTLKARSIEKSNLAESQSEAINEENSIIIHNN